MKIIAFKRSQNNPALHPEFITEYIDASLLKSTEGYETMIEEHFLLELAKNPERHESQLKAIDELEKAKIAAESSATLYKEAEERELNREFELFKRWRQTQKKK